MEFLSLSRRRSPARNVPSGEERGEPRFSQAEIHAVHSGFRVLDSRFFVIGTWTQHSIHYPGIPDSLSWIPNSKAQDSRFYKEKIPGFRNLDCLTWGERLYKPNISQNLTSLIEAVTCVVDWTVKTTAYLKALIFSDSWPATIHTVNGGNHRTGVLKKGGKILWTLKQKLLSSTFLWYYLLCCTRCF